jgi:hypothetical protein
MAVNALMKFLAVYIIIVITFGPAVMVSFEAEKFHVD